MPVRVTVDSGGGQDLANPFVGPVNHTVGIQVALSTMTTGEIDKYGYLKPGLPLTKAGAKIAAAGFVFGVTVEAVKVAANNLAATIAALGTQEAAVATIGQVNRKIAEANLMRVYTAAEIAGFDLAGCKLVLL